MEYNITASGPWLTVDDSLEGTKVKLVSECKKVMSRFKDDEGNDKYEDQVKAQFEAPAPIKGGTTDEPVNMRLNWTTIKGLVEAFGNDSKDWIGKPLTAKVKDATTGQSIYLIPQGSELYRNEEKRWAIRRVETMSNGDPVPDFEPVIE